MLLVVVNAEFELSLFGPEHHRLAFHAADHVEGRARLAPQGHLQQVFLDTRFDRLAQFARDFKIAIRRAKSADALVGLAMVVILDPELDPLAGRFKAVELGADQEVLPDRGPEPFDFAQGHRVLRAALDMDDALLFHLRLKATGPAPGGILRTVVGEHFLRRLILAGRPPVDLDHRLCRRAAEEISADHKARVIIHERDEIGIAPAQPEGEDIGLPQLVGRGPLKEARPGQVAPGLGALLVHQPRLVQPGAHRLRAGLQEEHPPQNLRDPLDAPPGFCCLSSRIFSVTGPGSRDRCWPPPPPGGGQQRSPSSPRSR